jgi:hypothetical protein
MKLNRGGATTSDKLIASTVTVSPGATLTVNNIGSTNLVAGDTFTLFSAPITGSFNTVNLPSLPNSNVFWTNQLAVNGTISVVSAVIVNPESTNITFSVSAGSLSLSWPADHIGWTLQAQTNTLGTGLGTNWVNVPDSSLTNALSFPISTGNGAVFYRLKF